MTPKPWTRDDEQEFWNTLTPAEKHEILSMRHKCPVCGSEYSKKLSYCPGCVPKSIDKALALALFLLTVFKVRW